MDEIEKFKNEKHKNIQRLKNDLSLKNYGIDFISKAECYKYSYNFTWMGRPVIQYPQDMIALQEIIWEIKPDLIIETGIAHGGSLIYYASLLELIGYGEVLGIDIDIRSHNRNQIENHSMFKRISMLEGSSTDPEILKKVSAIASNKNKIMVILDSNHTHEHVWQELTLYSVLVTKGSYLVVLDTIIEDMPEYLFPERPWGKGNNPKTAVHKFIAENDSFIIEQTIHDKLIISVAPDGYLKRIK